MTFHQIPTFSRYEISRDGIVRRLAPYRTTRVGKVLKPFVDHDGYVRVGIFGDDGKLKRPGIHQLIALTFIGPRPSPAHVVAHGNGDRSDNRVENLRWATQAENFADRRAHGTWPAGEGNANASLSDLQVQLIRAWVNVGGRPKAEIARLFGVSDTHVHKIVTGEMRRDAGGYLPEAQP